MGWSDYHLHQFEIMDSLTGFKAVIGVPDDEFGTEILVGQKQKIAKYFTMENPYADYVYDFGDFWQHKIQLEKILPREENVEYPICIKGKRACPPEDVGGIGGYEDFLEIIKNPDHEEYEEMLEWAGGKFDPEQFDCKEIIFMDPAKRLKMI